MQSNHLEPLTFVPMVYWYVRFGIYVLSLHMLESGRILGTPFENIQLHAIFIDGDTRGFPVTVYAIFLDRLAYTCYSDHPNRI